jgi:rhamnosyltransferase
MNYKICGTVILYEPTEEIYKNILSYYNQVKLLISVDNSDKVNDDIVNKIKSIDNSFYIKNSGNLGIANALNIAAEYAIKNGYEYMLTMDQDTALPVDAVMNLMSKYNDYSKIGIISPHHNNAIIPQPVKDSDLHESLEVMMCGNIINLEAHKKIGGFEEKLFIDYVDHDYCLRLNLNNYKVVQDNSISLLHKLGNRKIKYFFFMRFCPSNHSGIRLYYRTRNRFYVYKKYWQYYPMHILKDIKALARQILSLLLLEDDKIKKLRLMFRGYQDFRKNCYGKIK